MLAARPLLLQFEIDAKGEEHPKDVEEVVNNVRAMNYGLKRLDDLPLSLRLIREIHGKLLEGVRGANRTPGEFRRSQNWIGPANCTLATATFVPPPVHEMQEALNGVTLCCSCNKTWRRGSESALFRRDYCVKMPDFIGKSSIICLTRFN